MTERRIRRVGITVTFDTPEYGTASAGTVLTDVSLWLCLRHQYWPLVLRLCRHRRLSLPSYCIVHGCHECGFKFYAEIYSI